MWLQTLRDDEDKASKTGWVTWNEDKIRMVLLILKKCLSSVVKIKFKCHLKSKKKLTFIDALKNLQMFYLTQNLGGSLTI